MKRTISALVVSAALLMLTLAPVTAAAAGLTPHRAVYKVALANSSEASDVSAASGRMAIEWQGSACDGFVTKQRVVTTLGDKDGNQTLSDFRINSWESADGDSFNFSLVHYLDGIVVDEITGEADRNGDGGMATFEAPDGKVLKLPKGVMFPTEMMRVLTQAAADHQRVVESQIFDGSEPDYVFSTSAIFGEEGSGTGGESPKAVQDLLGGLGFWPVQISYFNPASAEGLPEYEATFRLYENGVSTGLLMDYGAFVLSGDLVELEYIPVPDC